MSLIMDTEQEKKISINYKVPERTRKIIRVVAAAQGISHKVAERQPMIRLSSE